MKNSRQTHLRFTISARTATNGDKQMTAQAKAILFELKKQLRIRSVKQSENRHSEDWEEASNTVHV